MISPDVWGGVTSNLSFLSLRNRPFQNELISTSSAWSPHCRPQVNTRHWRPVPSLPCWAWWRVTSVRWAPMPCVPSPAWQKPPPLGWICWSTCHCWGPASVIQSPSSSAPLKLPSMSSPGSPDGEEVERRGERRGGQRRETSGEGVVETGRRGVEERRGSEGSKLKRRGQ